MAKGLHLKPEPDGFGFLYGTLVDDAGQSHRVDIMPPLPFWHGDMKLTGEGAPHPTDWVAFIDGEEVARVREKVELVGAIATSIASR